MTHECKYEEKITEVSEGVAYLKAKVGSLDKRMNGSLDILDKHVNQGHIWRIAILGIIATLFINIVIISNLFGRIQKNVETNTEEILLLRKWIN